MKVELKDVIEAIEFENPSLNHFYNKKTGVIIYRQDKLSSSYSSEDIKNISDLEEWEKELVLNLHDLEENPQDYIRLPLKDEGYEYNMMKQFCNSFSDMNIQGRAESAEKLKDIIADKGLLSDWYEYAEYMEKELAIEWCNENGIEFSKLR